MPAFKDQPKAKTALKSTGVKWKCKFSVDAEIFMITPLSNRSASLTSITIDLENGLATASGIALGKARWSSRTTKDSAIGPWRGYLWNVSLGKAAEVAKGSEFLIAELDLLHRIGTDKMLLRHKVQRGQNRQNDKSLEVMFQFSAPAVNSR